MYHHFRIILQSIHHWKCHHVNDIWYVCEPIDQSARPHWKINYKLLYTTISFLFILFSATFQNSKVKGSWKHRWSILYDLGFQQEDFWTFLSLTLWYHYQDVEFHTSIAKGVLHKKCENHIWGLLRNVSSIENNIKIMKTYEGYSCWLYCLWFVPRQDNHRQSIICAWNMEYGKITLYLNSDLQLLLLKYKWHFSMIGFVLMCLTFIHIIVEY